MRPANKYKKYYILSDYFTSLMSWGIFFVIRQLFFDNIAQKSVNPDQNLLLGLIIIPIFWILLFSISGYYQTTLRQSKISEFLQTFVSVFAGTVILFFLILIDDVIVNSTTHYYAVFALLAIEFPFVYLGRLIITKHFYNRISKGTINFPTLIIGDKKEIIATVNNIPKDLGIKLMGYIANEKIDEIKPLPYLGNEQNMEQIIEKNNPAEVILAYNSPTIETLRNQLIQFYKKSINIKAIPETYFKMVESLRFNPLYGTQFMEVDSNLMPIYEMNLKRVLDIVFSLVMLIVLSPVMLYLVIRVKWDSKGAIFYTQTRLGRNGKPYKMYKFRSMIENAETTIAKLTVPNDQRVTPYGQFMRKYRLDELPQLWNVLIGDMSMIGPRPERAYYVEKMIEKQPSYYLLMRVKPGITSLGMVKYGYADNLEKMIERMQYDLIYIKNMSLIFDLKILIYTIRTVITGKGV